MKSDKGSSIWRVVIALGVAAAGVGGAIVAIRSDIFASRGSGLGEQFKYDLTELRYVDPKSISYRPVLSVETGFSKARGIATDHTDRLYVAGDTSIRVFDGQSGARLGEIPLRQPPQAIAVTAAGTIYVAMKDHVEVCAPDGKPLARWGTLGDRADLTGIAVADENAFVADAGNRLILRYDTRGNLLGRIGEKDPNRNIPGLLVPSPYLDVAIAPDGLLRVTNPGRRSVEAYTFDGDLELRWGRSSVNIEGFCGCCNPTNLAVLPDGSVVTGEKGIPRVKVYDPSGKFASVVAGPDKFAKGTAGTDLAVDSKNRIWVLDPTARCAALYEKIPNPERKDERETENEKQ